jgi:hypothetical protein
VETGKKGADVAIGSAIEHAASKGLPLESLGAVFALASALSDVAGAADVSRQVSAWMAELLALETCARNPTNPVAKSDPTYSNRTTAKIQEAEAELTRVSAVRFLNIMTETSAGITPTTAVLSIGLKAGFTWSEQALKDYSADTIMREARLAVVGCEDAGTFNGNVELTRECTTSSGASTDHELTTIKSSVGWKWNPATRYYQSTGTFMYRSDRTFAAAGGGTCTIKQDGMGAIGPMDGSLTVFDSAAWAVIGHGYVGGGSVKAMIHEMDGCGGMSRTIEDTVPWLPSIMGFPGPGGVVQGDKTEPYCMPQMGTERIKYEFMLPPMQ